MKDIQYIGPRLSDDAFFGNCLDYTMDGLGELSEAAQRKDFTLCKKIFGEYIRKSMNKDAFVNTLDDMPFSTYTPVKVEDIMKHIVGPCGIPYDFCGKPIDWFHNPTENGYKEWTWQLSRHEEILTLARAYRESKEEQYAKKCCEFIESWIKQAVCPFENPNESLCWRTIECGIRMSLSWPEIIHAIIESPFCSDSFLTDWCKSVYEHGVILEEYATTGNWLIMEMSGLLHISVMYPWFYKSKQWLEIAKRKLILELRSQVYPDGFHYELTTGYQNVLVIHYAKVIRLLSAYGFDVPQEFQNGLRDLMYVYIKLMRPDGRLPDLNDGSLHKASAKISPHSNLFPEDQMIMWAASNGLYGRNPIEKSYVLENAGYAVFRTGWRENDIWCCFDGGPFGRGHQHEDKLNLLLHANGKYILTEGNNYAYDDSPMRRYVVSSRGHNTILVDGMGQNRRTGYQWCDGDILKHSGILSRLSDYVDSARAVYNEGYGANQDKTVTHERSVYFVKGIENLTPFLLVVDRLKAAKGIHSYEVQWHLDAESIRTDGLNINADQLHIFVGSDKIEMADLTLEKGVTEPEWNGWTADSCVQNDYRPIYIAKHILHGGDLRWVTLLYPEKKEQCDVSGVYASCEIKDTRIQIYLKNGNVIEINEEELI